MVDDYDDESQYLLEDGRHQHHPVSPQTTTSDIETTHRFFCGQQSYRLCSLIVVLVAAGIVLISVSVTIPPSPSILSHYISKEDNQVQSPPHRTTSPSPFQEMATQAMHSLNSNLTNRPLAETLSTVHTPPRGPPQCETTIILLRHCDDHGYFATDDSDLGDKHCSHMGYERTDILPSLFGPHRRWPSPRYLYALLPQLPQGINYRQIETLLPLAQQENLTIHVVGNVNQVSNAFFTQLQQHLDEMCDTVTVIAWKHAFIPLLAAALGCGPEEGCPGYYPNDTFDQVWELKYVYEPEEPDDEVEKLFAKQSKLIADDYGLLAMQLEAAAVATAEVQKDGKDVQSQGENDDRNKEASNGWAVYGSITQQRFDPLQMLGPGSSISSSDRDL
mmetsp:Transcript_47/g.90  ORF Transcript_47/g.90 Transcript_47/m.90 type:complete len:389 (-) Transcript_47:161-1327(-)